MDLNAQPPEVQEAMRQIFAVARRRGCTCAEPMVLDRDELYAKWDSLPPENQHMIEAMLKMNPNVAAFLDHEERCPVFVRDWAPYN